MSPVLLQDRGQPVGFPRVSGDEPGRLIGAWEIMMFSPRERG